jgi:hypothetical protein
MAAQEIVLGRVTELGGLATRVQIDKNSGLSKQEIDFAIRGLLQSGLLVRYFGDYRLATVNLLAINHLKV